MAQAWDVRITDYDAAVPLVDLLTHPANPKIHPLAQTAALKGILGEVGWLTGLLVNQRTGYLLDGHDRLKAAMQAGQTTAPVFYVDVPPEQEAYVLATFDPVGTLAATDSAILDSLLRDVQSGNAAVQQLLADTAARAGLYDFAPSLDALEAEHGAEPDARAFWPWVKVQVPPSVYDQFQALLAGQPGADEAARFTALVEGWDA